MAFLQRENTSLKLVQNTNETPQTDPYKFIEILNVDDVLKKRTYICGIYYLRIIYLLSAEAVVRRCSTK